MLSMTILDDTVILPVDVAVVELSGCTPSQSLARRTIGVQDRSGSSGPMNLHSTWALSIRPAGSL